MKTNAWMGALGVLVALGAIACGEEKIISGGQPPPPARRSAAASASASNRPPPLELGEADFTPSDRNRDPFRGYAATFVQQASKVKTQEIVLADQYSLDELKLVALVSGQTQARAMFTDPNGKGWVVTRGQLVGRAELLKGPGKDATEYDVSWRVDRIRDGDVVFVREDPSRPNAAPATKVIALRPEGDQPPARR